MNERFTCKGLTIFENGEEIHTIKATEYLNSQSDKIKQMKYDYRELEKKYEVLSNESSELRGRVTELEKTEQITKADINEVLVALYEAELRYNQEYERIRYEEETLRKIPDLKSKMSLVELECKYNHLIRRYKVELERIKKEEND